MSGYFWVFKAIRGFVVVLAYSMAWDFSGLSFDPGIFGGFVGSPWFFFLNLIFAPIRSSLSFEILNTPLGV